MRDNYKRWCDKTLQKESYNIRKIDEGKNNSLRWRSIMNREEREKACSLFSWMLKKLWYEEKQNSEKSWRWWRTCSSRWWNERKVMLKGVSRLIWRNVVCVWCVGQRKCGLTCSQSNTMSGFVDERRLCWIRMIRLLTTFLQRCYQQPSTKLQF